MAWEVELMALHILSSHKNPNFMGIFLGLSMAYTMKLQMMEFQDDRKNTLDQEWFQPTVPLKLFFLWQNYQNKTPEFPEICLFYS